MKIQNLNTIPNFSDIKIFSIRSYYDSDKIKYYQMKFQFLYENEYSKQRPKKYIGLPEEYYRFYIYENLKLGIEDYLGENFWTVYYQENPEQYISVLGTLNKKIKEFLLDGGRIIPYDEEEILTSLGQDIEEKLARNEYSEELLLPIHKFEVLIANYENWRIPTRDIRDIRIKFTRHKTEKDYIYILSWLDLIEDEKETYSITVPNDYMPKEIFLSQEKKLKGEKKREVSIKLPLKDYSRTHFSLWKNAYWFFRSRLKEEEREKFAEFVDRLEELTK